MGAFYREFQRLMHRTFIAERKHDAQAVAQKLGISPRAFYGYIEGERTFPLDLLPDLFLATGEIEFLNFCMRGTGYTLTKLPEPAVDTDHLESAMLDVMDEIGDLAGEVKETTKDKRVDHSEHIKLCKKIERAEGALEGLKAVANGLTQTTPTPLRAVNGARGHQPL